MMRWLTALPLAVALCTLALADEPAAKPAKPTCCDKCEAKQAAKPECCEKCEAKAACCDKCEAKSACCAQCPGQMAKSVDEAVYDELTAMIRETDSQDVFVVAVVGLGGLGETSKRAIPVVIRNADRLGVLKGIAKAETPTPAQDVVMQFLGGNMGQGPGDAAASASMAFRAPAMPPPAPFSFNLPVFPNPVTGFPVVGATPGERIGRDIHINVVPVGGQRGVPVPPEPTPVKE
jgi:hypothetical protein